MKYVDLAVCTIRAHDILLDGFANTNLFDKIVEGRLGVLPFLGRNNLDYAGFHAVAIDFGHLEQC